jgi:hypothetical protein
MSGAGAIGESLQMQFLTESLRSISEAQASVQDGVPGSS